MARDYFKMIPNMLYDIDGSGNQKVAVDILRRVRTRGEATSNYALYEEYDVADGDTPEIIAYNVYGSSKYHWVIMMLNKINDPFFELPLSYRDFQEFIIKKYGSVARSQGASATVTAVESSTQSSNTVYTVSTGGTSVESIFFSGDSAFLKVPDQWYGTLANQGRPHQTAYSVFQSITKVESLTSSTGRIWTDYNSSANTTEWESDSFENFTTTLATNIHHWEKDLYTTANTTVPIVPKMKVDYRTYSNTSLLASHKREVANYDYEEELNETKRSIVLLRPEFLPEFVEEFEKLMRT
tara:strand:- start:39869 stop:40759 length:891 start_codon:yes stop_codon:yes gene_type:complete